MLAQWTADVVGQMHKWKISMKRLADRLGVSREYVSMVLNGHREPAGVEIKFRRAVEEIVAEEAMKNVDAYRSWKEEMSDSDIDELIVRIEAAGMAEYAQELRSAILEMEVQLSVLAEGP